LGNLNPKALDATFNVDDGSVAVEGATITLDYNTETVFTGTTDSNGVHIFERIPSYTYNYTVSADGFTDATGTLDMAGIDQTVNVTLTVTV